MAELDPAKIACFPVPSSLVSVMRVSTMAEYRILEHILASCFRFDSNGKDVICFREWLPLEVADVQKLHLELREDPAAAAQALKRVEERGLVDRRRRGRNEYRVRPDRWDKLTPSAAGA